MKKGYIVKNSITTVELMEIEIMGTIDDKNVHGEKTSIAIIKSKGKVIWSSHPADDRGGYLSDFVGNQGSFNTYEPGKCIREDVVTDLIKAKQMAQDLLAKEIKTLEKSVQGYQTSLKNLKNPVDWDTFPKDEYISPFTGKKA